MGEDFTIPHLPKEALKKMGSEGVINVCQAVAHGHLRKVKNIRTHKQGDVINAEGNGFTVLIENETEVWAYEDCEGEYRG
jgi:hypothetical protein